MYLYICICIFVFVYLYLRICTRTAMHILLREDLSRKLLVSLGIAQIASGLTAIRVTIVLLCDKKYELHYKGEMPVLLKI